MPAKQRRKPRDIKPPYSCDKPPSPPLSLEEVLWLMKRRPLFAYFIRQLLCTANSGDEGAKAALDCLAKWYQPVAWELIELCYPRDKATRFGCTDRNKLIEVNAYIFGGPARANFLRGGNAAGAERRKKPNQKSATKKPRGSAKRKRR